MVLNRKSAKKTSKISLLVAVTMLTTIAAVLQTQGYPMDHLAENGVQMCKTGFIEFLGAMLW
ncbi:hypothetical protein [Aliikangiella sp. G2MR2-5]|uniref:hypothetical protein n=1 Tax=Aliikangiella sp. G2MR2-5 TaxID=2788943 RepID=UPI0018AB772C|nr:hypothetical protein [Aliikangiella sp. G2MR2-5]